MADPATGRHPGDLPDRTGRRARRGAWLCTGRRRLHHQADQPANIAGQVRSHTALARQTSVLRTLAGKVGALPAAAAVPVDLRGPPEVAPVPSARCLTVFFSDIKDFTQTTDEMEPEDPPT